MPDAPEHVTAVPSLPWQPWDATDPSTEGGWTSVDAKSGPANMSGQASGDFENGPGPWKQT